MFSRHSSLSTVARTAPFRPARRLEVTAIQPRAAGPNAPSVGTPAQHPHWQPLARVDAARHHFGLPVAAAPMRARHAIPLPLNMRRMEAAEGGDPIAAQKNNAAMARYKPLYRSLPQVSTLQAFGVHVAQACSQLDYRDPAAPPVVLIGDQHGATATVAAVGIAAQSMRNHGMRGTMLVEFSMEQRSLLRDLENIGRPLLAAFGGYRPGLVDALAQRVLPMARERCLARGAQFSERELATGSKEWATQTLAMMQARDAGFAIVPIDIDNRQPGARRESHMRRQLARYRHQPLIVMTGGLHTNALLPALPHGNWTAITYGERAAESGVLEMVRRSWHQGVLARDPRYHLMVLSHEAAHADPFDQGLAQA